MVDQAELSVRAANDDEPPLCSLLFRSTPPLPRSEGGLSALDVRERLPSETAPSRSTHIVPAWGGGEVERLGVWETWAWVPDWATGLLASRASVAVVVVSVVVLLVMSF